MRHLLRMEEVTTDEIFYLMEKAKRMEDVFEPFQKPKIIANLFYEPSTRTKLSFEVAEKRLGYHVLDFDAAHSSVRKGESLYDTVKTIESLGADAVVIRHRQNAYYNELLQGVDLPIINGGDGTGEHPTQCLLDLFTIYEEFRTFKGINVVIAGDVLHSRVARSNAHTLSRLGAQVQIACPNVWDDPTLPYERVAIDDSVERCDVLMLLRVQHERHEYTTQSSDYLETYGLTIERERRMRERSIILHPAPVNRGIEIHDSLVECERSRIFKQMSNGVLVRMAVLDTLLSKGERNDDVTNQRRSLV
ncbi:aspartate carbamoyltransferase [Pontibacillus halophilus JSM 076056 = DSM 19796]|uniref:Aspartate carbamoyltransferase n=1 Tax=Pontibacillus halophilus JSM 076056 = DSM 19796 TaxID=1385510 RepID=A0A0A5GML7_9BACI|nr:aspartate carbamoyltransferase catalytic subunit [Pontibacillus halophilus]KGX93239.1 aspartate carbamoyltransferase [Pontibacillus halophilus JSM 076056 = DSM 19796]